MDSNLSLQMMKSQYTKNSSFGDYGRNQSNFSTFLHQNFLNSSESIESKAVDLPSPANYPAFAANIESNTDDAIRRRLSDYSGRGPAKPQLDTSNSSSSSANSASKLASNASSQVDQSSNLYSHVYPVGANSSSRAFYEDVAAPASSDHEFSTDAHDETARRPYSHYQSSGLEENGSNYLPSYHQSAAELSQSPLNHMVKAAAALGYSTNSIYNQSQLYTTTAGSTPGSTAPQHRSSAAHSSYSSMFDRAVVGDRGEEAKSGAPMWADPSAFFDMTGASNFFYHSGKNSSNVSSTPSSTSTSLYPSASGGASGVGPNDFIGHTGGMAASFGHYMLPSMGKFPSVGMGVVGQTGDGDAGGHTVGSSQELTVATPLSEANTVAAAAAAAAVAAAGSEIDYNPRDLEAFAERFKQRRIKLGVTQADVGKALGNLKIAGVGSLSQSTICRFESLTLSHNNMVALKPILQAWLEDAELEASMRMKNPDVYDSDEERKRKRTSITDSEKRSLEAFFGIQPRPSSEKIAQIAEKLNLKKNVVRVWFCNQRQKQKRMKFSTLGLLGYHSPGI